MVNFNDLKWFVNKIDSHCIVRIFKQFFFSLHKSKKLLTYEAMKRNWREKMIRAVEIKMVREQENVKSASDSGLYMIRRSWRSIHTTAFRHNFWHFHYSKCVPNKKVFGIKIRLIIITRWFPSIFSPPPFFFFLNISCKFIVTFINSYKKSRYNKW